MDPGVTFGQHCYEAATQILDIVHANDGASMGPCEAGRPEMAIL